MRAAPNLIEALAQQSGHMKFAIRRGADLSDAHLTQALERASIRIRDVKHPDEPDDPLASFISEVQMNHDFIWFYADIADIEEEPELIAEVVATVLTQLKDDGVQATLETFESS